MRITILTVGSRGDNEPYVALGQGLRAAGHDVRIATHGNFKDLIVGRGMEHFPVDGNPQEVLENEAGRRWLETGKRLNPFTFMRRMMIAAGSIMPRMLADYYDACRGADLIISHALAVLAAMSIEEKLKISVLPAYLQHAHPTARYPAATSPPTPALGALYNRLTYILAGQSYWQLMRPHINSWRKEALGLKPWSLKGPFSRRSERSHQFLYGFSSRVVPKAPEWGENVFVTGYWFLDKSSTYRPPDNLLRFLEDGEPPVFIGFSSMTDRNPEATTRMALDALRMTGARGIIGAGWGGIGDIDLPENVFRVESVPFDWLFPRMAAVAHHGGAGTTAAGLRAGVPSIVLPFFADQFFWGWRVSEMGLGPGPIPRQKLTADRLAVAIEEAIENPDIRHKAAEIGRRIRSEDGVGNAVSVIERFYGVHRRTDQVTF